MIAKGISHATVPSLVKALTESPLRGYYCYYCYIHQVYCSLCTKQQPDHPSNEYWAEYYTGYYTQYYANYFFESEAMASHRALDNPVMRDGFADLFGSRSTLALSIDRLVKSRHQF
mmetsp:Transcript_18713/g.35326  ORF Transcript_18713/g.35326 Transcript_18713/m.35326 type:complete len:116 (-) Transcript_18713:26-373(-)